MPTQIIDGFKLNAATPIDNRLVTNGLASRNSMQYKYEGLRVYDTADKKSYVFVDNAWIEDGGGGGGSLNGAGIPGFVVKFDSKGLTQSIIREQSMGSGKFFVGINKPNVSLAAQLDVGGTIKADGQITATKFVGAMEGVNIENASLGLNKIIPNAPDGKTYLLKCVNGTNQWIFDSGFATKIAVTNDTTASTGYLTFVSSTSGTPDLLVNSANSTDKGIQVKPSTSQLLAASNTDNDKDSPGYSFLGFESTGLHSNGSSINISLDGENRLLVDSTRVSLNVGGVAIGDFSSTDVLLNKTTTIAGDLTVNNVLTAKSSASISSSLTVGNSITVQQGNLTVVGSAVILPPIDTAGLLMVTEGIGTPLNRIQNLTGTGLYIRAKSEALRLDTESGSSNYISFFSAGAGEQQNAGSGTNRRGWIGFGTNTNWNMYIYNDMNAEIQLNTSGIVRLIGSQVAIDSDVNMSSGTLFAKSGQVRTAQFFRVQVEGGHPDGGSTPGPVYLGRYAGDQNSTKQGDFFIRVDKNSNTANDGDGYYSYSVNGYFSSPRLKLRSLPTSATGLASGSVWRDGTTLRIVV